MIWVTLRMRGVSVTDHKPNIYCGFIHFKQHNETVIFRNSSNRFILGEFFFFLVMSYL